MQECNYERHVRHFFDLPKSTIESDKISADFGVLVNLLATFEAVQHERLAQEIANLNTAVERLTEVGEDYIKERNALSKLVHGLQPYIRDLNAGNFDDPQAGIFLDRKLEDLAAEVEAVCNGGYSDLELSCPGCFGPCGQCFTEDQTF